MATDEQAQWIIEGYLLSLSALILIGGSLGDRYGRRRMFSLGTFVFMFASIACALSNGPMSLMISRGAQGVGAAFMIPESLALISQAFAPQERGAAIGIWAMASSITMAAGPVLGGWLTSYSWRWVFWINVPLAVIVLGLTYQFIPESRSPVVHHKPDWMGAASITGALATSIAALMEMQSHTNVLNSLKLLGAGIVCFVLFLYIERRAPAPIVPLSLFASRAFCIATLYTFLLYAALGGALFFVPFELQHVMSYTPLSAGLALLPTIGLIAIGSPIAGTLAAHAGPRMFLLVGAAIAAIGFALFGSLGSGSQYFQNVLPATLVVGVGLAIAIAPLATAAMSAAGTDNVGAASGINNSISRVGNLFAISVEGVVIAFSGAGALPTAEHPQAFVDAMLFGAGLALIASIVASFYPDGSAPKEAGNVVL